MRWTTEQYEEFQRRKAGATEASKLAPKRPPAHVTGRMNKTEARFALLLEARRLSGEIAAWKFESIKLRLGDRAYYTPDFSAVDASGRITLIEVKGGLIREDSIVKFKWAREEFDEFFQFEMWQFSKGVWIQIR